MTTEKVWQVSEVTAMVRDMLEQSLLPLWISGEIGNLTLHRSGHVYMTIKDAQSQMKAVFFGGVAQCRALDLRQGSKVEVLGKLSLYQAGGEFQLNVRAVRLCGVGTLQEQFEAMLTAWLIRQAALPASSWSRMAEAKAAGITDGTRPGSFATREEVATMIMAAR